MLKRGVFGVVLILLCLGILGSGLENCLFSKHICSIVQIEDASQSMLSEEGEGCVNSGFGRFDWTDFEELRRFAQCDNDSVELIVGVDVSKLQAQRLHEIIFEEGGTILDTFSIGANLQAITVTVPIDCALVLREKLRTDMHVRYVEPNFKAQAFLEPNDLYWSNQWGPRRIDADIAWETSIGSSDIIVAIIDTGVDYWHPDLAANYVPLGYDWVNNDTFPMDDHGHGTHCAGIVAAQLNNSIGISGLAQVRIMSEKVLDSGGMGSYSEVAGGIIHATDQGAKIISMSLGGFVDSDLVHDAVKYAYNHSVLIVAAAGNTGLPVKSYPGAYEEVIAVSATDESDQIAAFSSYGDWVDLSAPGVSIYSTFRSNTYCYLSGTSMACPHVAGVAALCWSAYPQFVRDQVREHLQRTADDLGDVGFDNYYGYGRVNARKAVTDVPDHDISICGLEHPDRLDPLQLHVFNTTMFNYGKSNETNISVQFLVNSSLVNSTNIEFLENGTSAILGFPWKPSADGNYNITCYAVPVAGENFTRNNIVKTSVLVRPPIGITVPDDFTTIQAAINNATTGDTVYVKAGIYYENIVVDKKLSLIGERKETTIIDSNWTGTPLYVPASEVTISGFTLQHSAWIIGNYYCGIYLRNSFNSNVSGNIIIDNGGFGIWLDYSDSNIISNNTVISNHNYGIWMLHSSNNKLRDNQLISNAYNLKISRDYIEDIDTSNTVNGKPIYYLKYQNNLAIRPETHPNVGYLGLIHCVNMTVERLQMETNGDGVLFFNTNLSRILNSTFVGNEISINLDMSYNNFISGNIIEGQSYSGIELRDSQSNTVTNNTIINTSEGITLLTARNNTLADNTIERCQYGIYQMRVSNSIIYGNIIVNSALFGLFIVQPISRCRIFHNDFLNNASRQVFDLYSTEFWDDGYPSGGNYWSDYTGVDLYSGPYQNLSGSDGIGDVPHHIHGDNFDQYPLMHSSSYPVRNLNSGLYYVTIQQAIDAMETRDGHVIFVNLGVHCGNITVNKSVLLIGESQEATVIDGNKTSDVVKVDADNITIKQLTIKNSGNTSSGINIGEHRKNIVISNVSLLENYNGVVLAGNNSIVMLTNNTISGSQNGIYMEECSNNTITQNTLRNNTQGIWLENSEKNIFFYNTVMNSSNEGIFIWQSSNNSIVGNNFTNNNLDGNRASIIVGFSSHNLFWHNYIVCVGEQVHIEGESYDIWDNGYPSGGNYWSGYSGADYYMGPFQNETGSDEIGDMPLVFDANNQDNYPLMKPWRNIAVTNVSCSRIFVGQGYPLTVTVAVENQGICTETFDVTLYANETQIVTFTNVTLAIECSTVLIFEWNTSSTSPGNYTISAYASVVEDEIKTNDNTMNNGAIWIGVRCDITGPEGVPDGVCNMRDIGYMCDKFGTTPSSPNWDLRCDVTGPNWGMPDGIVNMRDIGEACNNFMKT